MANKNDKYTLPPDTNSEDDSLSSKFSQLGPRKTLSDEIFEKIKGMIFSEELKPGERLPNERELSQLLGVGRPSLREALTHLTIIGLIENRKQNGYYVRSVTEDMIGPLKVYLEDEIKNLIDFMKVRKVLDVMTAKEAIHKRNPEDFQKIKENIDNGYKFHVAIAEATHNMIFVHVISDMHQMLSTLSFIKHSKGGSIENSSEQHQRIYDALLSGSEERVEKAIEEHIQVFIDEAMEKYELLQKDKMKGETT